MSSKIVLQALSNLHVHNNPSFVQKVQCAVNAVQKGMHMHLLPSNWQALMPDNQVKVTNGY